MWTSWEYTVDVKDVFHNDSMSFEEIRDAVVLRLRESDWAKDHTKGILDPLIDLLAETPDQHEFNYYWDHVYDLADIQRVWIATF